MALASGPVSVSHVKEGRVGFPDSYESSVVRSEPLRFDAYKARQDVLTQIEEEPPQAPTCKLGKDVAMGMAEVVSPQLIVVDNEKVGNSIISKKVIHGEPDHEVVAGFIDLIIKTPGFDEKLCEIIQKYGVVDVESIREIKKDIVTYVKDCRKQCNIELWAPETLNDKFDSAVAEVLFMQKLFGELAINSVQDFVKSSYQRVLEGELMHQPIIGKMIFSIMRKYDQLDSRKLSSFLYTIITIIDNMDMPNELRVRDENMQQFFQKVVAGLNNFDLFDLGISEEEADVFFMDITSIYLKDLKKMAACPLSPSEQASFGRPDKLVAA